MQSPSPVTRHLSLLMASLITVLVSSAANRPKLLTGIVHSG